MIMKILKSDVVQQMFFILAGFLLVNVASARGGLEGLEDATSLLQDIFAWAKTFVIAVASLYFIYLVVMAFLERKTWTDVLIGLVWCIVAGASAILAEWAVGYYAQ